MKITSVSAAVGAALLLAGAPILASAAETPSGPIQLDKVSITESYGIRDQFAPGLVTVAFTNQNDSPATNVVFALESNGKVIDRFEDVGSYAKGDTIRHSFPDIQVDGNQSLAVESATFADGTSWSSPDVSYAPAAPRTSNATIEAFFPYNSSDY